MGRFYAFTLLLIGFVLIAQSAAAQQSLILILPDTPCDSTSCAQINVDGGRSEPTVREAFIFRDGIAFRVDAAQLGPDTVAAGAPIRVPLCFTPTRRGQITDSLAVVVSSALRRDTFHVRVTGRGIGPELEPDPFALNFPLTNPGSTSSQPVTLTNVGEMAFTFDASSMIMPPPFQLATPGSIRIPPGTSINIDILFAPTSNGVYSAVAELNAGCSRRLQIALNGATDLIGTGAVLRTSKLRFNPVNEEETPCSVTQCTPVTISNAGNAALTIENLDWAIDTAGYRITSSLSPPLIIGPNSQRTFEVCLESRGRGVLRDTLVMVSNSRTSIAFGMVIDLSKSMDSLMSCDSGSTPSRISQAIEQGQRFIGRTLLHLPAVGIQDYLAIMRFSSATNTRMIFPQQPITDASRSAAQAVLNGLIPDGDTQTGGALARMMDTLETAPLENRVIVLLSDGAARDQFRFSASTLVTMAVARGIRIFTVQIGTDSDSAARSYLVELATANGAYFNGNDCGTLQLAFEAITNMVSRGHVTREPFAMRITSPSIVAGGDLRFDSTYYMTTSCRTTTLTNVGEGEAVIDSIQLRDALGAVTPEFTFGSSVSFPIRIPESGQVNVEICFTPSGLRQRGGSSAFTYNSCTPVNIDAKLSGTGWARAGMRIDDERVGLPGTTVTMPVYLDSSLSAFEVGTIRFQVRWNKSMLDLRTVRPLAAAGTGAISIVGPIRFEGREAVADFLATGQFLEPAGPLAELEFLVLRGDSLASSVTLSALEFEDGNPRPLMENAGLVAFDSTCFRDSKTILALRGASKLRRVDAAPVPALRGAPIVVTLESEGGGSAHVTLYAASGARVGEPLEVVLARPTTSVSLDSDDLSPGAYYLLIEDGSGTSHIRGVLVTR